MKTQKPKCPKCQSEKTAPVPAKGLGKKLGRVKYLCLDCRHHFTFREKGPVEPQAKPDAKTPTDAAKPPPVPPARSRIWPKIALVIVGVLVIGAMGYFILKPEFPDSSVEVTNSVRMKIPAPPQETKRMAIPKPPAPEPAVVPPAVEEKAEMAPGQPVGSAESQKPVTAVTEAPASPPEPTQQTQALERGAPTPPPSSETPTAGRMATAPKPEPQKAERTPPVRETPPPPQVVEKAPTAPPKATPQQPIPSQMAENKTQPSAAVSSTDPTAKRKLVGLQFRSVQARPMMYIQSDGPIHDYNFFILSNPPRLVIDLKGQWEKPDFTEIKVENSVIKSVRAWKHPDKLRIVGDLQTNQTLAPVFETTPEGLAAELKPASLSKR